MNLLFGVRWQALAMRRWLVAAFFMVGCAIAQETDPTIVAFSKAQQFAAEGKMEEAFELYVALPGAEFVAVVLARGEAEKYLALLAKKKDLLENPRVRLVEAELILAAGRIDEAKARFREIAASAPKIDWSTGRAGYYPVEPPGMARSDVPTAAMRFRTGFAPFEHGPGSHRDNWLLRRLIALDLKEEAAAEFARLWKIHQSKAEAYRFNRTTLQLAVKPGDKPVSVMREYYQPPGFNNLGLQFALDYVYFLKREGKLDESMAVLQEPLRMMDMDHMPNRSLLVEPDDVVAQKAPLRENDGQDKVVFFYKQNSLGTSRKDFIRLAFGTLKTAGLHEALIKELQTQIEGGENRPRRILAQILSHQGQRDAAEAQELAYIANGKFDQASSAFRRGLVFEEYGKLVEAVAAFEESITLKKDDMKLPDADERVSEVRTFYHHDSEFHGFHHTGDPRKRLARLYAALGRTDKVLEFELQEFETKKDQLKNLQAIEELAARFKNANKEDDFKKWCAAKRDTEQSPQALANLAWYLGDYAAALKHAAEIPPGEHHGWRYWQEKFAKLDPEREREFMRLITLAHPDDSVALMVLTRLEKPVSDDKMIVALEGLLKKPIPRYEHRFWSDVGFEDSIDVAYRLMRLYEKTGRHDALRALGLRLARMEFPFEYVRNYTRSVDGNGPEEYGNACLALTIQFTDQADDQKELAAALENSRWAGAKVQLARRMGSTSAVASKAKSPPWANLPPGVRAIVSSESVTCYARDDRYIYTGLSWGVAVYDFSGAPVTRILLGRFVTQLVATENEAWVGTEEGLFRIASGSWKITYEALGKVQALGLDGDLLWIGLDDDLKTGVKSLHRKTLEMRIFSAEEIGLSRTDFDRFVADGEYLWADGYYGLVRYHRASDTWSVVPNPVPNSRNVVHLIDIIDGEVWANLWLNDSLRHRPARLDRKTMKLTPLTLSDNLSSSRAMLSELTFHGHHHGQPVFATNGGYWDRFVMEPDSQSMRRLRHKHDVENQEEESISHPLPDGVVLPDGTVRRIPKNAWPDGLRAGISTSWNSDFWPVDAVWAVVGDDARKQDWLCGSAGLTVMPRDGSALRHFDKSDGLADGPIMTGAELGGKFYFGSGWDQQNGHLTRYDPQTQVFVPWFSADGMDSDRVVGLTAKDEKLEIRYGVKILTDDLKNQRAPGTFDPNTGRFISGGDEPVPMVNGEHLPPAPNGTQPLLGGATYRSYKREEKIWQCGARGLVIYPSNKTPVLSFTPMKVRLLPNTDLTQRAEAQQFKLPHPLSLAQLEEYAEHPNRHIRIIALSRSINEPGSEKEISILQNSLNHPYMPLRAVAAIRLADLKGPAVLPALRIALADEDFRIRSIAAIAMAERGEMPRLAFFEEMLEKFHNDGSYTLSWDIPIGYSLDQKKVYAALAPHADRAVFALLLRFPLLNEYELKDILPALGKALQKNPDVADLLLAIQNRDRYDKRSNFGQALFQQAGKEFLPILHKALASNDRVVRSNAALACGALGDASSIPFLLNAMDMESGLARASIAWALGELKASDALPRLYALHQDARNAGRNRMTGMMGYLSIQSVVSSESQYTVIRDLDAIASDWDEIKVAAQPSPQDPRNNESLLTPELVLEAIKKIGPTASIAFYRTLASSTDHSDRKEAALRLSSTGTILESDLQIQILRNLAGDPNRELSLIALVSLVLLEDQNAKKILIERLLSVDEQECHPILVQLHRLSYEQLAFARETLKALAAKHGKSYYIKEYVDALMDEKRKVYPK